MGRNLPLMLPSQGRGLRILSHEERGAFRMVNGQMECSPLPGSRHQTCFASWTGVVCARTFGLVAAVWRLVRVAEQWPVDVPGGPQAAALGDAPRTFEELKKALISAPALALPDVTKPFHLHVSEVRSITKGVLIQTLGPWKRPVAYLSKRLDPVVAGWPACLRAVATTALLVKEADK
ncbi:hypothetical protein QTO34_018144 [Cnephaeus nilssonii]|uniref:Reverse transcriptase/retrotransposon-derived protein RNase H-like domain-containing protein n=1 Tax=Cnephaeus nilssonii TaxID=3371016 RepID=A0AA40HZ04_CNENI|nr:hypothetical protein QTO34_018144 [Eptesicus nilssonii]